MTVEELLEELRQLPPTARVVFVEVRERSEFAMDRVTYAGGEAVIYLEADDEEDDEDDDLEDDDVEENDDHADQA